MRRIEWGTIAMVILWILVSLWMLIYNKRVGAVDAQPLPISIQTRVVNAFVTLTGRVPSPLALRSISTNATECLPVNSFGQPTPTRGYFVSITDHGFEFRYYAALSGAVTLCHVVFPKGF